MAPKTPPRYPADLQASLGAVYIVVTLAIIFSILALIFSFTASSLWQRNSYTGNIVSNGNSNVEVNDGVDLIVHDSVLLNSNTIIDGSSSLDIAGEIGSECTFGSSTLNYTLLQANNQVGIVISGSSEPTLFSVDGMVALSNENAISVAAPIISPFGNYIGSDQRVVTNVVTANVTQAFSNILSLAPRQFMFNSTWVAQQPNNLSPSTTYDGFIAQEVAEVLPQAIIENTVQLGPTEVVTDFKSLNIDMLQVPMVSVLQGLIALFAFTKAEMLCYPQPYNTPANQTGVPSFASAMCTCVQNRNATCFCQQRLIMCTAQPTIEFCIYPIQQDIVQLFCTNP
jgi:hypothetical protein